MRMQIKLKRIEKGYKQADIGKIIGVSRQTISLYERGKNIPKFENMKIISKFLGTPVQILFFDE